VTLAPFAIPGKRTGAVAIALGVQQQVPAGATKTSITLTTELLTSAFTPEGNAKGSQRSTAKVVLRPGADGEANYEVLGRIDLAPGRYRLRLAAHDGTSDKSGSVFADVEIPDFSNVSFDLSGLVLGAAPGRPAAPKDILAGILPFAPTAQREFLASDRVTAFLQVYQTAKRALMPVSVAIRIVDGHDVVRVGERQTLMADQFGTAQSTATAAAPLGRGMMGGPVRADPFGTASFAAADVRYLLPFDKLGPGPHLLTIEATLGPTTIRRDIRFVVQ